MQPQRYESAVPCAGIRHGRQRFVDPVQQHGAVVLRPVAMPRTAHAKQQQLQVAGRWQHSPGGCRRTVAGHRLLPGILLHGIADGRPCGASVPLRPADCEYQGQLEVSDDAGQLHPLDRVPDDHPRCVRHVVQPAQRPWLLRHVLRSLFTAVIRLPADHPVGD